MTCNTGESQSFKEVRPKDCITILFHSYEILRECKPRGKCRSVIARDWWGRDSLFHEHRIPAGGDNKVLCLSFFSHCYDKMQHQGGRGSCGSQFKVQTIRGQRLVSWHLQSGSRGQWMHASPQLPFSTYLVPDPSQEMIPCIISGSSLLNYCNQTNPTSMPRGWPPQWL